jgi:hypothetical protein
VIRASKLLAQTRWTWISLHSKRYDIIQNYFQANQPSYLLPAKSQQDDSDDEDKSKIRKKKLKLDKNILKTKQELGACMHNTSVNKDWLVSKNYKLIFNK